MKRLLYLLLFIPLLVNSQVTEYRVFHVGDSAWVDMFSSATSTKQGNTSLPHFNYDSLTLDFPYNDSTEIVYINYQLNHYFLIGTDCHEHLHYLQNESAFPQFGCFYRWLSNGQAVTDWQWTSTSSGEFAYTSGSITQILEFEPTLDGGGVSGVSSILQLMIYRREESVIGGSLNSDVQVLFIDGHIQIDSAGSDSEYVRSWD